MRDRPKTKSQRKAWGQNAGKAADVMDRAAAVSGSAGVQGLSASADRLGTPGAGKTVL